MDCFGRHLRLKPGVLRAGLLVFLLFFFSTMGTAFALNFEMREDVELDLDIQLKYDTAWRIEDQSPQLSALSEGDRNFDDGDQISNKFSTTIDIDFKYYDTGIFIRPRAYYDTVYDDDKFPSETKDLHRDKAEILDAYGYINFKIADIPTTLRAGRQVVNWGESMFIANSIGTAQLPLDVSALVTPDVQFRDIFLPTNQVMGKVELGPDVSIEGYYQFEWEKSRYPDRGSYYNDTDLLDDAGNLMGLPQGQIDEASDDGQYGVAVRYVAEKLNYTEFGLYYLNYHEKLPMFIFGYDAFFTPSYYRSYAEDIKLYGFTVSTQIGQWQVSLENTYRENYPVAVHSADPVFQAFGFFTYEEKDVFQSQVSFMRMGWLNRLGIWDSVTVLGEVGFNKVMNVDEDSLIYDDFAWGFVVQFQPEWLGILPALDLFMPITYTANPRGDSSVLGTFVEHNDSVGIKFNFVYKTVYEFSVGYTNYFGGSDNNVYDDRDSVSASFKYTF